MEIAIITYWKMILPMEYYIESINLFDKVLVACNEMSNETIEILYKIFRNINWMNLNIEK